MQDNLQWLQSSVKHLIRRNLVLVRVSSTTIEDSFESLENRKKEEIELKEEVLFQKERYQTL